MKENYSVGNLIITNKIELLTLAEVGAKIKLNDPKSIKNWVRQNGITIHKLASTNYVYDVDLMISIYRPLLLDFAKKYPHNWEDMCKKVITDESVFNVIMETIQRDKTCDKPIRKIKFSKAEDEKLYRELIA